MAHCHVIPVYLYGRGLLQDEQPAHCQELSLVESFIQLASALGFIELFGTYSTVSGLAQGLAEWLRWLD